MAKQTFTTGQVLTAAQMTSLQQTAMLGGNASVKTASYVLVAADAGTTVAMNASGSTTITVNTGLFSAGDTVFIQNRGAGNCTVTAGTATVATAGSLILPQNDAGILYFNSASSATFYDFIQVGATSPLTTKGDIYVYGSSDTRLPVGTNNYVLTADSAETTGLKWAAASGGGETLINTGGTSLSGSSSTTISSIPQIYNDLKLVVVNTKSGFGDELRLRVNGDSSTRYVLNMGSGVENSGTYSENKFRILYPPDQNVIVGMSVNYLPNYTNTTTWKMCWTLALNSNYLTLGTGNWLGGFALGAYNQTDAITSLNISANNSFTQGTAYLYGIK